MQRNIVVQKALIPHLFLPRVLPTEQSPELPLHENTLLRLFADVLVSPAFRHISALNCARQAFGTWADLQWGETIDPQRLSATIRELRPGQHLPLLIREQNAGLIISVPKIGAPSTLANSANSESDGPISRSHSGDRSDPQSESTGATESNSSPPNRRKLLSADPQSVTISTFPASLPNAAVLSAPALTFEYPSSSVRVPFSLLLTSGSLAEQIALMHVTSISAAASKSQKAGKECDEVGLLRIRVGLLRIRNTYVLYYIGAYSIVRKSLELEWTTRIFLFCFETERVDSIQKPSGIWTHTATMQNNLKPSKLLIF